MHSALEVLKRLSLALPNGEARRFVLASSIETTLPHVPRPEGVNVSGEWDRGGKIRNVRVCTSTDKAELYICTKDEQVTDEENNEHFSNIVIARYSNDKFEFVNHFFFVELEEELYNELRELRVVPQNADPAHLVRLDIRHLPVFPVIDPDVAFVNDKLRALTLKSEIEKLRSFKTRANKYFRDNEINFPELDAPRAVNTNPVEKVIVEVPTWLYSVTLPNDQVVAVVDLNQYRGGAAKGFTQVGYFLCKQRIAAIKAELEPLSQKVRIAELSFLEHSSSDEYVIEDAQGVMHRMVLNTVKGVHRSYVSPESATRYVELHPEALALV